MQGEWKTFKILSSHISPKVKIRDSKKSGKGLFAVKDINKDEIIADYSGGLGEYVNGKKAGELYEKGWDHMIQVDEDLFFAATKEGDFEDADFINHSCNASCGIKDKLKIVAMRDIKPGEEITIDYAMMESSDYSFKCNCGSGNCRKIVTGNDWKIKELQDKYVGYFSDYLQNKIDSGDS